MIMPLGRIAAGFAAFILSAQWASAAELKVLSTPALSEVWADLKPKFEASGHKLEIAFAPGGSIPKRVADGDTADVLFSTVSGVEAMTKDGKVLAGTGTPIANSGVGVAVLKGTPKPDISTPEALKKALLSAKAVAYTDPASGGASGIQFAKVLDRLGISSEVNAKAKLGRNQPSAGFLVKGEADLAVQQIPELMSVQGVEIVGPLPGDLQTMTYFAAGVNASSASPDAGRALIKFMQSPEAIAVIKAKGLELPVAAKGS